MEQLEFHTLKLGWYNLVEDELGTASELNRWLFWLLHAHQYDTREKAIRDQQWLLNAAREEGLEQGEIRLIQTLQDILGLPVSDAASLHGRTLLQLQAITADLRSKLKLGREGAN